MACSTGIARVLPDRKFTREPVAATRNAKGVAAKRVVLGGTRASMRQSERPIRGDWLIFATESTLPKAERDGRSIMQDDADPP